MDNDLFTATETLNNAFKEVLKKEQVKNKKWNIRAQINRLRKALAQRNLTISEKLLVCYGTEENLFPSKTGVKQTQQEIRAKRKNAFNEYHELLTKFCELPEEEQERIRQEVFAEEAKIPDDEQSRNRSVTLFEPNDIEDDIDDKEK